MNTLQYHKRSRLLPHYSLVLTPNSDLTGFGKPVRSWSMLLNNAICVVFGLLLLAGCLFLPQAALAEAAGAKVLFILDGSGSMWGRVEGNKEKIVVAKERLTELVQGWDDVNMGLIVYGHRTKGDCDDIEMLVPLGAGNQKAIIQQIQAINPKGKTPIQRSIMLAAQHLETLEDETEIVLVSDGLETCDPDPCGYVKTLKDKGIKFKLDVVGFDIKEEEREQLECLANAGGGRYYSAKNAMQLKEAFTEVKVEVVKKVETEDFGRKEQEVFTDPEAQLVVRYGDIDNLGFGWPTGFDPFSGKATPIHNFPWKVDPQDADGTDCILVPSSYKGSPPKGQDGYTSQTSRPANMPRDITMRFRPPTFPITSAILQMFVDDFQSPSYGTRFQVTMNGMQVPELEVLLNSLNQGGPIGKLITFQIPERIVETLPKGELKILVDDPKTGAGDGFAFDFFRLLINHSELQRTGIVQGSVYDAATNQPLSHVTVAAGGVVQTLTDEKGAYELHGIPAGLAALTASLSGYASTTSAVDLVMQETVTLDFHLTPERAEEQTTQPKVVKRQTVIKRTLGTIKITNLKQREVYILKDGKWIEKLNPNTPSKEMAAGKYGLAFVDDGSLITQIDLQGGETVDIVLGGISLPNLAGKEIEVIQKDSRYLAGKISAKTRFVELGAGTYRLAFGNYYIPITVEAGQTTELLLGSIKIPNLQKQADVVTQQGDVYLGPIHPNFGFMDVPPGTYKVRISGQWIEGIEVGANDEIVIE